MQEGAKEMMGVMALCVWAKDKGGKRENVQTMDKEH